MNSIISAAIEGANAAFVTIVVAVDAVAISDPVCVVNDVVFGGGSVGCCFGSRL